MQHELIGISRHRIGVDGEGVTTLVAYHGCPLRCRYSLNQRALQDDGVWRTLSTEQLILKSATKPFNVFLACTRPLITELTDDLN